MNRSSIFVSFLVLKNSNFTIVSGMLFRFSGILRNPYVLGLLIILVLNSDVPGEEKTGLISRKEKTELPECFFEEMNRLEQRLDRLPSLEKWFVCIPPLYSLSHG